MFKRAERVQELLRHEISTYIQQVTDPHLGFVTITGVKITDDLLDAKVFYSVYGTEEEQAQSTRALIHMVPQIRHHIGKNLESLYKAPTIQFVYDDTAARAQRVTDLMKQLAQDRPTEDPNSHDKIPENQTPKPNRRRRKEK